jgi:hypothetical protein
MMVIKLAGTDLENHPQKLMMRIIRNGTCA